MDKYFQKILDTLKNNDTPVDINDNILIVDFLNTYLRSFTGSPAMNDHGEHCGGITGFLYSLGAAIRACNATRVIIVSDGENSTQHRKKLYPQYKEKRSMKMNLNRTYDFHTKEQEDELLVKQMIRLLQYLECLPLSIVVAQGTEADDSIAYIATEYFKQYNNKITIMSSDKDFLQLVDDKISVWSPKKKKLYNRQLMYDEFGIYPENYVIARSLIGDESDNIVGIDGIGLSTAKKRFPMLTEESIIHINDIIDFAVKQDELKKHKLKSYKNVIDQKNVIVLNEQLMNLRNPIITDKAKLFIYTKLNEKINSLKKTDLYILYMKDGLSSAMPDINKWLLQHFHKINNLVLEKYSFIGE